MNRRRSEYDRSNGVSIHELAFVNLFPEFSNIDHALAATERAVPSIRKIPHVQQMPDIRAVVRDAVYYLDA